MSPRYSEKGNRPVKPGDGTPGFASVYKTEITLTAVMIAFASTVYIVLCALGITSCTGLSCEGKPADDEQHSAPVSVDVSHVSASDASKVQDMGDISVMMYHTLALTPDQPCTAFSSSDESIATVDQAGSISPVAFGTADITGTADSGASYVWHLNVRKVAYLTFSDFPNANTDSILTTLAKNDVKATFFLCVRTKSEYFPYYEKIIKGGHLIGNHTSSHDTASLFESTKALKSSLIKFEDYMHNRFSYRTKFVSIPNGSGKPDQNTISTKVTQTLHDMGYTVVDYTIEAGDYTTISQSDFISNIRTNLKNDREIIGMHFSDTCAQSLDSVIALLKDQGYECESLYEAPETYCQYYGWETNVNRRGAELFTPDMLNGLQYTQVDYA